MPGFPLRLAALCALAVAASACSSGDSGDQPPKPTPMGHTYLSTRVEGGAIPGGGPMTLTFDDGRITANSGCNTSGGAVDLSDNVLRVSRLAGTLMGCPGERGQADAWQTTFLEAGPTWRLDGDDLTLTGADVTVHLTDKKIVTPDRSLTGTTWIATTLITPDAKIRSAALDEAKPTLTISDDGTVSGTTGCNRLTGTAQLGPGGQVSFDVATTKMMCAPEVMDVERHVLGVLDGHTDSTIDADTLTLRNTDGTGLELRAQQ
ncbi:META domain-containing protein [Nocardia caishijiensis]|uniref:Heat shock protein HslJ n=1 Tax=Nocardia caishijiensis TaxID=184756 RepID=A0ABQ6YNV3_9NOCA|nr:META domain-containing protein [Nocardia caishijiensis]KAF0847401.1 heat shock protein HslJ [Nocardia caishijiensis]